MGDSEIINLVETLGSAGEIIDVLTTEGGFAQADLVAIPADEVGSLSSNLLEACYDRYGAEVEAGSMTCKAVRKYHMMIKVAKFRKISFPDLVPQVEFKQPVPLALQVSGPLSSTGDQQISSTPVAKGRASASSSQSPLTASADLSGVSAISRQESNGSHNSSISGGANDSAESGVEGGSDHTEKSPDETDQSKRPMPGFYALVKADAELSDTRRHRYNEAFKSLLSEFLQEDEFYQVLSNWRTGTKLKVVKENFFDPALKAYIKARCVKRKDGLTIDMLDLSEDRTCVTIRTRLKSRLHEVKNNLFTQVLDNRNCSVKMDFDRMLAINSKNLHIRVNDVVGLVNKNLQNVVLAEYKITSMPDGGELRSVNLNLSPTKHDKYFSVAFQVVMGEIQTRHIHTSSVLTHVDIPICEDDARFKTYQFKQNILGQVQPEGKFGTRETKGLGSLMMLPADCLVSMNQLGIILGSSVEGKEIIKKYLADLDGSSAGSKKRGRRPASAGGVGTATKRKRGVNLHDAARGPSRLLSKVSPGKSPIKLHRLKQHLHTAKLGSARNKDARKKILQDLKREHIRDLRDLKRKPSSRGKKQSKGQRGRPSKAFRGGRKVEEETDDYEDSSADDYSEEDADELSDSCGSTDGEEDVTITSTGGEVRRSRRVQNFGLGRTSPKEGYIAGRKSARHQRDEEIDDLEDEEDLEDEKEVVVVEELSDEDDITDLDDKPSHGASGSDEEGSPPGKRKKIVNSSYEPSFFPNPSDDSDDASMQSIEDYGFLRRFFKKHEDTLYGELASRLNVPDFHVEGDPQDRISPVAVVHDSFRFLHFYIAKRDETEKLDVIGGSLSDTSELWDFCDKFSSPDQYFFVDLKLDDMYMFKPQEVDGMEVGETPSVVHRMGEMLLTISPDKECMRQRIRRGKIRNVPNEIARMLDKVIRNKKGLRIIRLDEDEVSEFVEKKYSLDMELFSCLVKRVLDYLEHLDEEAIKSTDAYKRRSDLLHRASRMQQQKRKNELTEEIDKQKNRIGKPDPPERVAVGSTVFASSSQQVHQNLTALIGGSNRRPSKSVAKPGIKKDSARSKPSFSPTDLGLEEDDLDMFDDDEKPESPQKKRRVSVQEKLKLKRESDEKKRMKKGQPPSIQQKGVNVTEAGGSKQHTLRMVGFELEPEKNNSSMPGPNQPSPPTAMPTKGSLRTPSAVGILSHTAGSIEKTTEMTALEEDYNIIEVPQESSGSHSVLDDTLDIDEIDPPVLDALLARLLQDQQNEDDVSATISALLDTVEASSGDAKFETATGGSGVIMEDDTKESPIKTSCPIISNMGDEKHAECEEGEVLDDCSADTMETGGDDLADRAKPPRHESPAAAVLGPDQDQTQDEQKGPGGVSPNIQLDDSADTIETGGDLADRDKPTRHESPAAAVLGLAQDQMQDERKGPGGVSPDIQLDDSADTIETGGDLADRDKPTRHESPAAAVLGLAQDQMQDERKGPGGVSPDNQLSDEVSPMELSEVSPEDEIDLDPETPASDSDEESGKPPRKRVKRTTKNGCSSGNQSPHPPPSPPPPGGGQSGGGQSQNAKLSASEGSQNQSQEGSKSGGGGSGSGGGPNGASEHHQSADLIQPVPPAEIPLHLINLHRPVGTLVSPTTIRIEIESPTKDREPFTIESPVARSLDLSPPRTGIFPYGDISPTLPTSVPDDDLSLASVGRRSPLAASEDLFSDTESSQHQAEDAQSASLPSEMSLEYDSSSSHSTSLQDTAAGASSSGNLSGVQKWVGKLNSNLEDSGIEVDGDAWDACRIFFHKNNIRVGPRGPTANVWFCQILEVTDSLSLRIKFDGSDVPASLKTKIYEVEFPLPELMASTDNKEAIRKRLHQVINFVTPEDAKGGRKGFFYIKFSTDAKLRMESGSGKEGLPIAIIGHYAHERIRGKLLGSQYLTLHRVLLQAAAFDLGFVDAEFLYDLLLDGDKSLSPTEGPSFLTQETVENFVAQLVAEKFLCKEYGLTLRDSIVASGVGYDSLIADTVVLHIVAGRVEIIGLEGAIDRAAGGAGRAGGGSQASAGPLTRRQGHKNFVTFKIFTGFPEYPNLKNL